MYNESLVFLANKVEAKPCGSYKAVVASGVDMGDWIYDNKDAILDFIGTYELEKFLEKNS